MEILTILAAGMTAYHLMSSDHSENISSEEEVIATSPPAISNSYDLDLGNIDWSKAGNFVHISSANDVNWVMVTGGES